MADFSQRTELSIEIPSSELSSARSQIEGALSDIPVSLGDGPAARATDGGNQRMGASGPGGNRRMRKWARQRTEDIGDIKDILLNQNEGGGGGGGGGGGMMPGMGMVSRGVGMLAGSSLASLVTKVPLSSLLTKAPAFATLVTAADLGADLVTGKLGVDDLISAPIELGDMVTFGLLNNDVIEGAIGTATLAIGSLQIAGGLSSLLGSVGIGSILSGLSGSAAASTMLSLVGGAGVLGIGAVIGGTIGAAALVADYFGLIDLGDLIDSGIDALDYIATLDSFGAVFDSGIDALDYINPVPSFGDLIGDGGTANTPTANPREGMDLDLSDLPGRDGGRDVTFSGENLQKQQAFGGGGGGGTQSGSESETRRGNMSVDNRTDITVETQRDESEIVDDVMSEVERDIEQLRRDLERALGTNL